MRILGIDPGLATMGWGMIEVSQQNPFFIACGVLQTSPDMDFPERLIKLSDETQDLISLYQPDEIVFEELFFARNVTTALLVGAARGVALTVCARYTSKLYEYTPMQVKQAVVGYGKADKHQVQQMVKAILHLKDIPKPDDAADGLAIALAHAGAGRFKDQFKMK